MDKEQIQQELISLGMCQSPQWPEGLVYDLCEAVINYPDWESKQGES